MKVEPNFGVCYARTDSSRRAVLDTLIRMLFVFSVIEKVENDAPKVAPFSAVLGSHLSLGIEKLPNCGSRTLVQSNILSLVQQTGLKSFVRNFFSTLLHKIFLR